MDKKLVVLHYWSWPFQNSFNERNVESRIGTDEMRILAFLFSNSDVENRKKKFLLSSYK